MNERIRYCASVLRDYATTGLLMALIFAVGIYVRARGAKFRYFGAVLLALSVCGAANAQHRNVCGLRHVAPLKVAAVQHHAAPIVAQVVNHHHAQAIAVVDPHAYAYPYYYQVGQGLRIEAIAEKTAEKLTAGLEALIEKKVAERMASGGAAAPDGVYAAAQAIADKSCVSCHSAETDPDRLDLTDLSKLDTAQLTSVFQQVYSGKMPKNSPALSDEEVAAFTHLLGSK